MAAGTLSIGGTPRSVVAGSLHIIENINGRSTLTAGVRSLDGSYIPEIDDEVEYEDDTSTVRFAGLVTDPAVGYLVQGAGLITTVGTCGALRPPMNQRGISTPQSMIAVAVGWWLPP